MMDDIKKEIYLIKKRNVGVEADKAWETSIFRVVFISIITYIITATIFYFIGVKNYLLSALIPTVGYYLSTQSLPFVKNWWVNKIYKK
ncbi:MAG: hypothetical protein A3D34_03705 [Candidatus Staskawiczbacteria bacterium RIFCSPHIGHO2_02_FULL_33_16]|uniref:Uncharacterized protein n=1 Tax=Candidatus Staskawiczbacteria bacterium RIFCSPHIGHO2_02_FULL_33_16 TaxID=1802204 RepID=A0A1G2HWF1_9BACT|nr:MAG: hypothetical protein A3D34_03705 [Candidatus Staskawiczbacteria bacterium RIFCSPHIGHO2_02_FULL_33_16]OGZ70895.1 MAG: hypothetical protein A2980_02620 [Candidatus Staskawiczbacteria bacterium RIFCSPLOWO2_01_FULL_33_13]